MHETVRSAFQWWRGNCLTSDHSVMSRTVELYSRFVAAWCFEVPSRARPKPSSDRSLPWPTPNSGRNNNPVRTATASHKSSSPWMSSRVTPPRADRSPIPHASAPERIVSSIFGGSSLSGAATTAAVEQPTAPPRHPDANRKRAACRRGGAGSRA
jgi:hypothetical protein